MIGGALTGLVVSAATNNNKDKVVIDTITGGAIATAAEILNYHYLTWSIQCVGFSFSLPPLWHLFLLCIKERPYW